MTKAKYIVANLYFTRVVHEIIETAIFRATLMKKHIY